MVAAVRASNRDLDVEFERAARAASAEGAACALGSALAERWALVAVGRAADAVLAGMAAERALSAGDGDAAVALFRAGVGHYEAAVEHLQPAQGLVLGGSTSVRLDLTAIDRAQVVESLSQWIWAEIKLRRQGAVRRHPDGALS
jgi:hypothetical protein